MENYLSKDQIDYLRRVHVEISRDQIELVSSPRNFCFCPSSNFFQDQNGDSTGSARRQILKLLDDAIHELQNLCLRRFTRHHQATIATKFQFCITKYIDYAQFKIFN